MARDSIRRQAAIKQREELQTTVADLRQLNFLLTKQQNTDNSQVIQDNNELKGLLRELGKEKRKLYFLSSEEGERESQWMDSKREESVISPQEIIQSVFWLEHLKSSS